MTTPAHHQSQQNYFARNHKPQGLPSPVELAQRVEEARTSSKLLLQVVQSTPPTEIIGNELIKEFVERCQSASRSIQGYIHSDNPPPDEDTLLTLIETNDQISVVLSKYQRALLQARRTASDGSAPPALPAAVDGRVFEASANPRAVPLSQYRSHLCQDHRCRGRCNLRILSTTAIGLTCNTRIPYDYRRSNETMVNQGIQVHRYTKTS